MELDMEMSDEWKLVFQNLPPQPISLGMTVLRRTLNALVHEDCTVTTLATFLGNIPHKNEEEANLLKELLLAPPTVEAARRCKYLYYSLFHIANTVFVILALTHD